MRLVNKSRVQEGSLGDAAYQAIRDAIMSSKMKPGDRVSEYMVAEWLNISRTPAREGLRRLESEGLLAAHPKRGLMVANFDETAIHELYAAREILESMVAALAARLATDAEISALQHMLEREAALVKSPAKMFEHNIEFHTMVAQAARNRYLSKFLQSLSDTLSAHRRVSTLVSPQRRDEVLRDHRELVDAIARHDEQAARAAAQRHIQGALKARLTVQRQTPTR
jgi:DNA-binding GntR family transcriptional regulator